jgi:hypothetical protein
MGGIVDEDVDLPSASAVSATMARQCAGSAMSPGRSSGLAPRRGRGGGILRILLLAKILIATSAPSRA